MPQGKKVKQALREKEKRGEFDVEDTTEDLGIREKKKEGNPSTST